MANVIQHPGLPTLYAEERLSPTGALTFIYTDYRKQNHYRVILTRWSFRGRPTIDINGNVHRLKWLPPTRPTERQ
jgi:hypothetical protein